MIESFKPISSFEALTATPLVVSSQIKSNKSSWILIATIIILIAALSLYYQNEHRASKRPARL